VLETEAVTSTSAAIPPRKFLRSQTFKALHYRNFALLWIGMILSNVGTWVQIIAQSLLVLQLTHNSGLALGLISFAQAAPFLVFSLVGGSTADRVDKRRLLLVTQSLQIVYAFTLGALTITGLVQFWQIAVLAVLAGVTLSFDQPTRFALIPRLVPREDLSNAIALNAIVFNGAAIVGPALGGALVVIIGYAGDFFLNGLSYVAVHRCPAYEVSAHGGYTHELAVARHTQRSRLHTARATLGTAARQLRFADVLRCGLYRPPRARRR
jgi:MFS family permease